MRKFLAVPAIILVLSFFVTSVQATVPVVADLPDMAFLTGSSGSESGGDMFDLDGYVDDFDDADADLSWTDPVATSGITPVVNVDGTSHVAWNISDKPNAKLTLTGNVTMDAPTGLDNGAWVSLELKQNATGSYTVSWNSVFKFPDATAPTIAATANYKTLLFFK